MSHTSPTQSPTGRVTPLKGAVCVQHVRKGGKTHGPYYARFWREDGRMRKQFVKGEDVERVTQACQLGRELRDLARQARRELPLVRRDPVDSTYRLKGKEYTRVELIALYEKAIQVAREYRLIA